MRRLHSSCLVDYNEPSCELGNPTESYQDYTNTTDDQFITMAKSLLSVSLWTHCKIVPGQSSPISNLRLTGERHTEGVLVLMLRGSGQMEPRLSSILTGWGYAPSLLARLFWMSFRIPLASSLLCKYTCNSVNYKYQYISIMEQLGRYTFTRLVQTATIKQGNLLSLYSFIH